MNKEIFKLNSIIILLFLSINLFSQESENSKFKYGINLGGNLFELKQNYVFERYNGRLNYSLGFSIEYKIHQNLSLLSNINYDRKTMVWEHRISSVSNGGFGSYTIEDEIRFSYINIPVFLKYNIGKSKKLGVNLGGFYNHALNIENEAKVIESESPINEVGDESFTQQSEQIIDDYDYGILFGVSYQFALTEKNHFTLELRNEFGLVDISQIPVFSKIKTNTLKLMLKWQLPI